MRFFKNILNYSNYSPLFSGIYDRNFAGNTATLQTHTKGKKAFAPHAQKNQFGTLPHFKVFCKLRQKKHIYLEL